ncbi:hypothetical protein M088_4620 [Bacteroides ovatus str. 3725 D1 iv]|nr:hypothetical protein M088_4570 [Bacteroides ovatus str. 3725 D1 iv]KDS25105.1 hypothetical protein M088_4620 [Bacteroides ovatus str. 3725 D1 iv]
MDVETGRLLSAGVKFTRFTHYMYRMKTTSNKLITNIL